MRTHSCLRLILPFLVGAALLAGAATGTSAQEAGKAPPSTAATAPFANNRFGASAYDLEIKEGVLVWNGSKRPDNLPSVVATLKNVVDLLRDLHPEANFAVSPGVGEMLIADLKMRTSSVEEKLEAVRIASGSEFLWRNVKSTPAIDPRTGLAVMPESKPSPALYILEALPVVTKPGLQVEAFNIGTYLTFNTTSGKGSEEDVQKRLDQIERMALETVKEYETINMTLNPAKAKSLRAPAIRFHPGANLAIVIGEPEAVAVAAKVIGALPGVRRSVASGAPGNDEPSQKTDEVLRRLQRDATAAPR